MDALHLRGTELMRGLIKPLFVALSLFSASKAADSQFFNPQIYIPTAAVASYTGPGDVLSGANAFWGLRAYSAATRGTKAVNVCNVSDVVCADLFTDATTGNLTITTIGGSDCTSVTCTIKTWYDQTGTTADLTQATIANRATLTVSCLNSLPCADYGSAAGRYFGQVSPGLGVNSFPMTIYNVAVRASGTAEGDVVDFQSAASGETIQTGVQSTSQYFLFGSNGSHEIDYNSATNGSWHVAVGVVNGTSPASVLNVDGTETTGTITKPTQSGATNKVSLGSDYLGGSRLVGKLVEGGMWGNVIATGTQRTNLCHNAFVYWATSTSC